MHITGRQTTRARILVPTVALAWLLAAKSAFGVTEVDFPTIDSACVKFSPTRTLSLENWNSRSGPPPLAGAKEHSGARAVSETARRMGAPPIVLVQRDEVYETNAILYLTGYSRRGDVIFRAGPYNGQLLVPPGTSELVIAEVTGEDQQPTLTWLGLDGIVRRIKHLPDTAFSAGLSNDGKYLVVRSERYRNSHLDNQVNILDLDGTDVAEFAVDPAEHGDRIVRLSGIQYMYAEGQLIIDVGK